LPVAGGALSLHIDAVGPAAGDIVESTRQVAGPNFSYRPADEGFIVANRIVYAGHHVLTNGSELIVWYDRAGNDLYGRTVHSTKRRRIVTAKQGEVILWKGEPRTVASVRAYRQHRLTAQT
jgi:hypothetical protein